MEEWFLANIKSVIMLVFRNVLKGIHNAMNTISLDCFAIECDNDNGDRKEKSKNPLEDEMETMPEFPLIFN